MRARGGLLGALLSAVVVEAVYTELVGDCVTSAALLHGPFGTALRTIPNANIPDCEAECSQDSQCSGFSFTASGPDFGCVLRGDLPYAGWCDTEIGTCTATTCFYTKTVLPEGFFIARVPAVPYGLEACQQACEADHRQGRLLDYIENQDEFDHLTAILGPDLDVFIGYYQPAAEVVEPGGGWRWANPRCGGGSQAFQPPWHDNEPNDWAPRLSVNEDCATLRGGKILDVTCEFNHEMGMLPDECLCQTHDPCPSTSTSTTTAIAAIGVTSFAATSLAAIAATTTHAPTSLNATVQTAAPTSLNATVQTAAPTSPDSSPPVWGLVAVTVVIVGFAIVLGGGFCCGQPKTKTKKRSGQVSARMVYSNEDMQQSEQHSEQLPLIVPVPLLAAPLPLLAMTPQHQLLTVSRSPSQQSLLGMHPVSVQSTLSLGMRPVMAQPTASLIMQPVMAQPTTSLTMVAPRPGSQVVPASRRQF